MWQARECSNCQNEVFAKPDEVDVFCDKCEEIVSLKIKVEQYEKALKTIVEMETVEKRFGENICTATGIVAQYALKN